MMPDGFAGIAPCVHCGFCLQSCPTFLVTGDEADSPRGRIVLMRALASGTLPATDAGVQFHLDRCLGCRACEPVCPSGVRYGESLEAARELIGRTRAPSVVARLVLAIVAEPALRRPAMAMARLVRSVARGLAGPSRLGFAMGMLAATSAGRQKGPERQEIIPSAPPASPAFLFRGCIMDGLFSHVNQATVRTLGVNGYAVEDPPGQGCCGALHAHAGLHAEAAALARRNVQAFAGSDAAIAVNSAGCGAMLKDYGRLLAGDPLERDAGAVAARVRDVSELLADRGPRPGAALDLRVAYDAPCHLQHAQRVSAPPLAVLNAIPGLNTVMHAEADVCCGSAGIYSLTEPDLSREVLARKTDALAAARPDVVATGNPGCVMQIGAGLAARGLSIDVVHPVELLDRSYAAAGWYGADGPH